MVTKVKVVGQGQNAIFLFQRTFQGQGLQGSRSEVVGHGHSIEVKAFEGVFYPID